MKMYQFLIPETGHVRTYKTLGVCKYQAKRCMKSLMKKGLISCRPEIQIFSIENGIKYFIPCDVVC